MNDNNKRLAELLGIEPKYNEAVIYPANRCNDKCTKPSCTACASNYKQVKVSLIKEKVESGKYKLAQKGWMYDLDNPLEEVFPDFREPENFVKLLKLSLGNYNSSEIIFSKYVQNLKPVDIATLEERVIRWIVNDLRCEYNQLMRDRLRQQAQQVNWKYQKAGE